MRGRSMAMLRLPAEVMQDSRAALVMRLGWVWRGAWRLDFTPEKAGVRLRRVCASGESEKMIAKGLKTLYTREGKKISRCKRQIGKIHSNHARFRKRAVAGVLRLCR